MTICKHCGLREAEDSDREHVPQGEHGGLCWRQWGSDCPPGTESEVERLRAALVSVRRRLLGIGPGADLDADPDDPLPENMVGWEAAIQEIDRALGEATTLGLPTSAMDADLLRRWCEYYVATEEYDRSLPCHMEGEEAIPRPDYQVASNGYALGVRRRLERDGPMRLGSPEQRYVERLGHEDVKRLMHELTHRRDGG